ncbi:hypothetical protein [Helicobacter sp. 11S03491-1]|uniref:hypothetical protein n=1 Tax=Helicobacter sp. 11S03491-1 TaxID=1476196 RepID=UPI000BA54754|nr:hypothetical protein [Helicobacter sp. 11S03491-1]PAF42247.1 hypothetical protein BKH45_04700 [Helicobacter sp. 11S03491-1]
MKKTFLALILFYCYFYSLDSKSANDYLKEQSKILQSYYNQVKKQSIKKQYPIFRGRKIIEHSVYLSLDKEQKKHWIGQIVFSQFILQDFIKYSNFGGIGVAGILADEYGSKKPRIFYLKLDGRYLSDLESLGIHSELYTYCILPNFNQCILLGIGEEWK